jgi:hypothetical protein
MTADTVVRVSSATLVRDVAGESVLLHADTGEYFRLDAIGTRVWRWLADRGRLGDVCAAVVSAYDVAPDVAARDVEDLIAALAARRLVIVEEPPV